MKTTETTFIIDKIINGLKKATVELEEFRLQAALGKAEARDAYESAKKKFNEYLHEAKLHINNVKDFAKEKSNELKTILENLQVQLVLGKAETKETFEMQKKKITKAIEEIEILLRKNKTADEYFSKLQIEIEKFKIKLEILSLYYELNKLQIKDELETRKHNFAGKLSELKDRLLKKEAAAEVKWKSFSDEISEAYSHLRKAFVG